MVVPLTSKPASYGIVAGIRTRSGGRHVTATDQGMSAVTNQLAPGDAAYVVKGHKEPFYLGLVGAPINDGLTQPLAGRAAAIIEMGMAEIEKAFVHSPCGPCAACCVTLYIPDDGDGFTKASHTPCSKLCAKGCGVYKKRPRTCRTFKCVWLKSQTGNRPLPAEMRPDRCGAILTDHEMDKPTAIHFDPFKSESNVLKNFIRAREREGEKFFRVSHYSGESK